MEFTKKVGYEIKTLDHMISRRIMNISIKNGMDSVTVMHGWIIGYLYDHSDSDVYQKDLESKFYISRSTATNILKLMEKKGYIERVPVEHDARLKKIILTEKARKIQRQNYIDMHNTVEKQLRKDISDEDMENFIQVIWKMKENLMKQETGKEQEHD